MMTWENEPLPNTLSVNLYPETYFVYFSYIILIKI